MPSPSNRGTNNQSQSPLGSTDNTGGSLYPRIPASAPPAEPSSSGFGGFGSNVNNGGYQPPNYPTRPSSYYPPAPAPAPANIPSRPSSYPSGYDRDDTRNTNPYPNPYGNNRDDPRNRGGSKTKDDDDDSGGLSSLFNIFSRGGGGGGNTDRYGSGGSSSSGGLDYGSIFNALAGGNRPSSSGFGNPGGSNGLSGILSSFGSGGGSGGYNRNSDPSGLSGILSSFGGGAGGGSSSSGSNGLSGILSSFGNSNRGGSGGLQDRIGGSSYDDRRQQPASSDSGSGFLSSLSSLFGQQIGNQLIQGALNNNRGQNDGASGFLNSIQNRRYGGLFNENTGHAAGSPSSSNSPKVTVSGAGPGGYPTQAPAYPRQTQAYSNQAQAYPSQASGNNNQRSYTSGVSSTQTQPDKGKPVPYGWTVGQQQQHSV